MQARVIVLVHDTSSHHALYVYQVSLKYLLRFFSYRADTKLYGKESKGNNYKDMKARVMVFVRDTSSHHALLVYQVSLKYL